jgi:heme-degrading monooxygenase HmoA
LTEPYFFLYSCVTPIWFGHVIHWGRLKITLQQATGNLPRKEFLSIYNSLAFPAASCGECARYCGPMAVKVFIKRVIPEGKVNGLLPLFRRLRNSAIDQPGYISGETLRGIDNPGQFLVISTWQSIDHWRQWIVCPARIEIQNEINSQLEEEPSYEIYQYG